MGNEDNETNVKKETGADTIARVKMPSFCHSSPHTWFALADSTFIINNIKSDDLKYHHILTALPEDIIMSITDIIHNPPQQEKYKTIKETILTRHSESETKRLSKLLDGVSIGDDTPSQYYRRLEQIAGTSQALTKELLVQIWMNGLPTNIKTILAATDKTVMDDQLKIADKIHEMNQPPNVSEVSKESNSLARQIEEIITKKFNEMSFRPSRSTNRNQNHKPFNKNRSSSRSSRSRSQVSKYPLCYFHHKFGNKARNCRKPCNFETAQHNKKN